MKRLYRTYDESTQIFKEFQKKFPKNFELSSIGKTWEKRDINIITISADIETAHKKPALFFTGTIHAREWIGHELSIVFAEYILNNIDIDPTLEAYLKSATIYMVPCANPDGFTYSQTHFSFWRKNRRVNADGTYGVDLNRNFSVGFIKSNLTTSNIYGGPEPFSEPETKALKDFVESHENITIALDYHSQGNVFFPAHDFRHEDTLETTDLNVLCANMADKIKKISSREYGIHQGKPPAKLIGGSGREFYYSKDILATVVEVGTRNISDYLDDMNEHLREHIPALIEALKEVPNYDKDNPLKRVENFEVKEIGSNHVNLSWNAKVTKDIFFEIYRNKRDKMYCKESNLIARTQALEFSDTNLQSNTNYYFNIRAVNKRKKLKSPFSPQIKIRTDVEYDEYSRTYYANASQTGYVAENVNNNDKHFGVNSLFVGVDENKGVSYSIITIDLKTIPANAVIKSASLNLYPINRVSTTIEKFGEWNIAIIDQDSIEDITDFDEVENAKVISYIGRPTKSDQLTQGIWRKWELSGIESLALTSQIENEKVIFRVEGPTELKVGRKSQMMQWDIGYGKFGFGLNYRPRLELTYTIEPTINKLYAKSIFTIAKQKIFENEINSGFDQNGNKIYCALEFNLSSLPSYEYTVITNAYIELNSTNNYIKDDIRFHLEFIDNTTKKNYSSILKRKIIQNIGYDVSANDLKNNQTQYFVFDSFAKRELNERLKDKANILFVLTPTSSIKSIKNKKISWEISNDKLAPKLIIEHIPKRRFPLAQISNAKYEIENGKIKISWENPKEEDLVGVKVIKNPYRKPLSSHDGQKIYAGKDNYTYDDFGAKDKDKYFAIFTYDDVPNYSKPIILEYKAK
ncbi:M14 family zinc carboxypeptidase [Arcobacter sp. CECT 8985]|uniref:M14 family zinc carboxypeptidase n=1 Tax=Arcobacter sp. CECT 8985 TaxID=1935424 RepID=UPI00100C16F3|nr:M14 family zinc carboxypeptidase [Arcobacter sp. CECT 8985]RXJ87548.1 peptidase [Arcobacter sp. CECT 8985]